MLQRIISLQGKLSRSERQFALSIKMNVMTYNNITKGRHKPSLDLILSILTTYPQVSADWLLLGKGKMFRDGFDENGLPEFVTDEERQDYKDAMEGIQQSLDELYDLKQKVEAMEARLRGSIADEN